MIERAEFQLTTPDTHDTLFMQTWRPIGTPSMGLLITHGVLEHSECYNLMAPSLAEAGIQVFGWDLPGHGRSYGQRGYIEDFQEYIDRLSFMVTEVRKIIPPGRPLVLMGHSLGGLITLKYALNHSRADFQGLCLSSPALGVVAKVPMIKDQAARLLARVAPRLTIAHELSYEDLSHDKAVIATYYKDPLRHKKFSAPLYLGMLAAMDEVNSRAHQLLQPMFIQAAGTDRIVSLEATKAFFERAGSAEKRLQIYPESYHEIFNETNRKEVIDDLLNYLREFHHA